MNFTLVRWCAVSCFSLLLAACGGGSDAPAAGPSDAAGPTSECLPTLAHFEALQLNATPEEVAATVGCDGRRIGEATIGNAKWVSFDWGSQDDGPYLYATFVEGLLADVTATRVLDTGPAACLPSRAAVDQLRSGMTPEQVSRVIGCPGELLSLQLGGTGENRMLAWGVDDRGPFLIAVFDRGQLSTTTAMRL